MTSAFDPDVFMQETVDGANDTEYPTVPPGTYTGVIDEIKMRQIESKKEPGKFFYPLDITWNLLDIQPDVLASIGRERFSVRQTIFVDMADSGGLDLGKGKNIQLGKLREAVGLNNAGFSLKKLQGAGPAKVNVSVKPDNNGTPRNEVSSVGKA